MTCTLPLLRSESGSRSKMDGWVVVTATRLDDGDTMLDTSVGELALMVPATNTTSKNELSIFIYLFFNLFIFYFFYFFYFFILLIFLLLFFN